MTTKKTSTTKKTTSRSGKSSGSYKRTNAPRRPARVKSESDLARDNDILGICLIAVAVLLLINFLLAPDAAEEGVTGMGVVSQFFMNMLLYIGGRGAVILPVGLLVFGIFICLNRGGLLRGRFFGLLLLFLAVLGFFQLSAELTAETTFREYFSFAVAGNGGGALGAIVGFALISTIGKAGAVIALVAISIIGLLLALQTSLMEVFGLFALLWNNIRDLFRRSTEPGEPAAAAPRPVPVVPEVDMPAAESRDVPIFSHGDPAPLITTVEARPPIQPKMNKFSKEYLPELQTNKPAAAAAEEENPYAVFPVPEPAPEPELSQLSFVDEEQPSAASLFGAEQGTEAAVEVAAVPASEKKPYVLPTPALIEPGLKVRNPRMNKAITESIGVLESTLESFGVRATVNQVVAGPAVTRYELQPAPGVKVSKITALSDDIALALAAQGVRIEAPIPGKNAIGIEVARKETDTVYFREMIESDEFQKSKAPLSFALGKNISGEPIIGDLVKMPHLLIAGTTGSGKSVCQNTIICSLLFKSTPDELKLLLIDPKKVEMTQFAALPHLIAPVVTDSKKAANALKWVVNEMENRYTLFAGAGVKKYEDYNTLHPENKLPHIVVIIDELADLMMVARRDVEESICRLAQLARAAGIHLVVATQRPSVDVITGLIKANIPSRIAFAVSSYTDSRTMIDMGGAEKLLGNGDMLYSPIGSNKPLRVQGTFINEQDVERLVKYCATQAAPAFSEEAVQAAVNGELPGDSVGGAPGDNDDLLYDAAMLIISTGQASTSFLQRRLAIGNPRAARLMDMLEARGVVGGPKGSKPRDILVSAEEAEAMLG